MIYDKQIEIAKTYLPHIDHELKRQARLHREHANVTMNNSARGAALKLEKSCLECAAAVREGRYDDIRYNLSQSIVFNSAVERVCREMGVMTG